MHFLARLRLLGTYTKSPATSRGRGHMLQCPLLLLILFLNLLAPRMALGQLGDLMGTPNPLLGKTGIAGPASVDGASLNPAQAADVPRTQVQVQSGIKYEIYYQRYPGFPTHQSNDLGLYGLPIPGFVVKPNKRIGLAGFLVPFPVGTSIERKDLPLIILGQENRIDLVGEGKAKFIATGLVGFSIVDGFSVGFAANYLKAGGVFDLLTSGAAEPLATATADITQMGASIGFKLDVSRISLGITTRIYSAASTSLTIDSSLQGALGEGGPAAAGAPPKSSDNSFMNPIRGGVALELPRRGVVRVEAEYKRAGQREEFSFVDFSSKPKDTHDTLSAYTGLELPIRANGTILSGFSYEPAEVGAGGQGAEAKAGFGFTDIISGLGAPPSRPRWSLAAGYRHAFGKPADRRGKKDRDEPVIYPFLIEAGVNYGETSIGIPNNGEQPGAYLVRSTGFPIKFSMNF